MNTQDGGTPQTGEQTRNDFMAYPLHKLVSVFETPDDMQAAVDELQECGYSADDIEAFCGYDGEKRMDFAGTDHGTWGAILRSLQHVGPDRTYLERYEQHLHDGHCIVMLKVTNLVRKQRAARIMHNHTKQQVTYFSYLSATEIL